MTQNDILTLARAGFTAQQISALAQMQPVQQMQPIGDPFAQQLAQLTQAIQANGILSAQQPKLETADDVLASIINPPKIDKK